MAGFFDDPWWLCSGKLPQCAAGTKRDITIQHPAGVTSIRVIFPGNKEGFGHARTDGFDPKNHTIYFFEPFADDQNRTAHYIGQVVTHSEPGGTRTTTVQGKRLILEIGADGKVNVVAEDDWTSNRPPA